MIQQLLTISRNTFIEGIRQPIYVVILLVALLILILGLMWTAYSLETEGDNKLLIDMGLSTVATASVFLAAFTATGAVSAEIENRTVLTVVSKPVRRPLFIAGKFLGIIAAQAVAFFILSLAFLMVVRHKVMTTASDPIDGPVVAFGLGAWFLALLLAAAANYFYRWVFASTFVVALTGLGAVGYLFVLLLGKQWQFQSIATEFAAEGSLAGGQMLIALAMVFFGVLMLTAVAVAASTRLGQVMTLMVALLAGMLGLMNQSIIAQVANPGDFPSLFGQISAWVVRIFCYLIPNLQFVWPADALTQGHEIPLSHLGLVAGYSALFISAALALAVALFQNREVG